MLDACYSSLNLTWVTLSLGLVTVRIRDLMIRGAWGSFSVECSREMLLRAQHAGDTTRLNNLDIDLFKK